MRDIEAAGGEITAPAGGHLAREQTDKREARPLPEAERSDELTLGVLERESDRVYGRDGQSLLSLKQKGTAKSGVGQINFWRELNLESERAHILKRNWGESP